MIKKINSKLYISKNPSATQKIASDLTKQLEGGEIICLEGNLGSGKTIFTKGLARGFNIKQTITSPTFVLMKIYKIRTMSHKSKIFVPRENGRKDKKNQNQIKYLVHIDGYRLKNSREMIGIGILEYLGRQDTITAIEWPEKIKPLIDKKKQILIKLEIKKNNKRLIIIKHV